MHTINRPYTDRLSLLQSGTHRTDCQSVLSVCISLSILDMGGGGLTMLCLCLSRSCDDCVPIQAHPIPNMLIALSVTSMSDQAS